MDEQFFDNTDLCYYSADMYSIFSFFSDISFSEFNAIILV